MKSPLLPRDCPISIIGVRETVEFRGTESPTNGGLRSASFEWAAQGLIAKAITNAGGIEAEVLLTSPQAADLHLLHELFANGA